VSEPRRDPPPAVVDLAAAAEASAGSGPVWSHAGEDLNANLVVLGAGGGVAEHVNAEVEVLLVAVAGEGVVTLDGARLTLRAGQALVVPKGSRRAIAASGDRFAYLTCHRRRGGLWPANAPRPEDRPGR